MDSCLRYGQGGSHAGRSRHTGYAVDQKGFDPVSHLFNEGQKSCGLGGRERVGSVRVRGIGERELQQNLAIVFGQCGKVVLGGDVLSGCSSKQWQETRPSVGPAFDERESGPVRFDDSMVRRWG